MKYGKLSNTFISLIRNRIKDITLEGVLLNKEIRSKIKIYERNAEKESKKIIENSRREMKYGQFNVSCIDFAPSYTGEFSKTDLGVLDAYRNPIDLFGEEMLTMIIVGLETTKQETRLVKLEVLLNNVKIKFKERFDIDKLREEFYNSELYKIKDES